MIRALRPDVLAKGADWQEADIIGGDVVKENGGRIVRIPVIPDISTTAIIEKILRTFGQKKGRRFDFE